MSHYSQSHNKDTHSSDQEPTLQDVINAINGSSTENAIQFTRIDERFTKIDERFTRIDERLNKIEKTMITKDELTDKLAAMETRLVTKSYLDDKLLDLKGDLIVIARKEDSKVDNVIGLLQKKNIFSAQEATNLLNPPVFAKTV